MEIGNYYWHGDALKNKLCDLNNIKSLKIASAFISDYGIDFLKEIITNNKLAKNEVEVFLSPEFSYNKPGKMLGFLTSQATTYIVVNIPFHAKVVWVETDTLETRVIFGSSNFTKGGIERNIEFNLFRNLKTVPENEKFKMFFDFCRNNSKLVNQEIIDTYLSNEADYDELMRLEKNIKKKLGTFKNQQDSFAEDDFNLKDYYFQFEDYETFFDRNEKRNDTGIMNQRKSVKEKMLEVHNAIYKDIQSLNLNCHKRKDNITSLIRPAVYNKNRVGWLGIRYGKSPKELEMLNKGADKDEEKGFQKHACLQLSITKRNIEINLFHAVPNDAFDREYVHGKLNNQSYINSIIIEIRKLKGNNLIWYIYDNDTPIKFEIDNEDEYDFIGFYRKNDMIGRESFLCYSLEPDDIRLENLHSISTLVKDKIKLMLPLYQLISFRI